jgi:hypothetical protein
MGTEHECEKLVLVRKGDGVYARIAGQGAEVPVSIVLTRPISARSGPVSIVGPDKKELLLVNGLDQLNSESRGIAQEELDRRYLVPRITRVIRTRSHFGSRYWDVETDRGRRKFVMKDPNKSVTRLGQDRLIIRDTLGNGYEIESLSALDAVSRAEVARVV